MRNCLILISFCFCLAAQAATTTFYVATNGLDTWSGTLPSPNGGLTDGPFKTIEKARAAVQALNVTIGSSAYIVNIRQGTYRVISNPSFYLHYYDSGSPANPVTYQAYNGEDVHISGGLAVTNWLPVSNVYALAHLPSPGSVYQADLSPFPAFIAQAAYGIQIGDSFVHQNELFWNGSPMTVAQYPNDTNWLYVGAIGSPTNSFTYTNLNASFWTNTLDIMAVGFWKFDYLFEGYKVTSFTTNTTQVTLTIPSGGTGWNPPTLGHRFKFVNVLEELDTPGEYYFDRPNKIAYFWPPTPIASGVATISEVNGSTLNLNGPTNLVFRGLTFEDSAEWLMVFADVNNITFDHCTNRNCASYLCYGQTCTNVTFSSCELSGAGQYGMWFQGGNRTTLSPGNNIITNSLLHDHGRLNLDCRAVVASGSVVGLTITHNHIYNIPGFGFSIVGNNNLIEYNEIDHVVNATSDAGAMYIGGSDWTYGGNIFRYNYVHDVACYQGVPLDAAGQTGMYLDDCATGVQIFGNCFDRVFRGIEIGGGRSNGATNNFFIDCGSEVMNMDQRLAPGGFLFSGLSAFETKLAAMPYTTPPWSTQYPYMGTILTDNERLAVHNWFVTNLIYGVSSLAFQNGAQTNLNSSGLWTNTVQGNPGFVSYPSDNFRLIPSSPLLTNGFTQIPFDIIGPLPNPNVGIPGVINTTTLNVSGTTVIR